MTFQQVGAVAHGRRVRGICTIPGCGRAHEAHGWCNAHYQRWKVHGDPTAGRPTLNGDPQRFFRQTVLPFKGDGCITWPYARDAGGYAHMEFGGRVEYVARLVCREVYGAPPTSEHQAAHSCGKGHEGCVSPMHLSWKTVAGNAADRFVHGTVLRGENAPNAKLTPKKIAAIRSLRGRLTQREIAEKFGVSQSHVSAIQRKARWGHQQ